MLRIVTTVLFCLPVASAWVPTHRPLQYTALFDMQSLISADDLDLQFDVGQGGVRLAEENALVLKGSVSNSNNNVQMEDFKRYKQLTPISNMPSNINIIATGSGRENYVDPGEGTEKVVIQGPQSAIEAAGEFSTLEQSPEVIYINFCGGNDTQVTEIVDAVQDIVTTKLAKSSSDSAKIYFNSMTHPSIALGHVSLAVFSPSTSANDGDETQQAIAAGQVFFDHGSWYALLESNINPDLI